MYIRNRFNRDGAQIRDVRELQLSPELREALRQLLCDPAQPPRN